MASTENLASDASSCTRPLTRGGGARPGNIQPHLKLEQPDLDGALQKVISVLPNLKLACQVSAIVRHATYLYLF
jgi:hypothetical protein